MPQPGRVALIDCCPLRRRPIAQRPLCRDRPLVPISTDYLSLKAAEHRREHWKFWARAEAKDRAPLRADPLRPPAQDEPGCPLTADRVVRHGSLRTAVAENVVVAESPSLQRDVFSHNASSNGPDYHALYERS